MNHNKLIINDNRARILGIGIYFELGIHEKELKRFDKL